MASVLLLHAWWGRTPPFAELGERFGRAGYTVAVPDLYGDGRTADTIADAEALSAEADLDAMTERAADALTGLEPPVAAVGFSLGAAVALQLLCNGSPLRAAVLHYGTGFIPEALAPPVAVLGHFASDDPFESREYIAAVERGLADAGARTTFHTYPGTHHWFAEPDRPEHDPAAAALAWERTLAFLRTELSET